MAKPVSNLLKLVFVVMFFAVLHLRETTRDEYVAAAPERSDSAHTVEITMNSRTVYLTAEQQGWLDNLRTTAWAILVVGVAVTMVQDRRL